MILFIYSQSNAADISKIVDIIRFNFGKMDTDF